MQVEHSIDRYGLCVCPVNPSLVNGPHQRRCHHQLCEQSSPHTNHQTMSSTHGMDGNDPVKLVEGHPHSHGDSNPYSPTPTPSGTAQAAASNNNNTKPPQGHSDSSKWPALAVASGVIKAMDEEANEAYMFGGAKELEPQQWLAPWQPTELDVVDHVVELGSLHGHVAPVVLDLGCGDGRVAIWIAKHVEASKVFGWDVAPSCVNAANTILELDGDEGVKRRALFCVVDASKPNAVTASLELSQQAEQVTTVYAYLVRDGLLKVRGTLREVAELAKRKRGTRVQLITNTYHFEEGEFWPRIQDRGALRLYQAP